MLLRSSALFHFRKGHITSRLTLVGLLVFPRFLVPVSGNKTLCRSQISGCQLLRKPWFLCRDTFQDLETNPDQALHVSFVIFLILCHISFIRLQLWERIMSWLVPVLHGWFWLDASFRTHRVLLDRPFFWTRWLWWVRNQFDALNTFLLLFSDEYLALQKSYCL